MNWYDLKACRLLAWCKTGLPSTSASLRIHVFSVHQDGRDLPGAAWLRGREALNADQACPLSFLPIFHICRCSSALAGFAASQSPAGWCNSLKTPCSCYRIGISGLARCSRSLALLLCWGVSAHELCALGSLSPCSVCLW